MNAFMLDCVVPNVPLRNATRRVEKRLPLPSYSLSGLSSPETLTTTLLRRLPGGGVEKGSLLYSPSNINHYFAYSDEGRLRLSVIFFKSTFEHLSTSASPRGGDRV